MAGVATRRFTPETKDAFVIGFGVGCTLFALYFVLLGARLIIPTLGIVRWHNLGEFSFINFLVSCCVLAIAIVLNISAKPLETASDTVNFVC